MCLIPYSNDESDPSSYLKMTSNIHKLICTNIVKPVNLCINIAVTFLTGQFTKNSKANLIIMLLKNHTNSNLIEIV